MKHLADLLRHKLNRTAARVVMLLAAVALAVFAVPSAAMAEANFYQDCEYDWAICTFGASASLPQGVCMTTSGGYGSTQVCIDYAADAVYVRDGKADGYGAVAHVWSENGVKDRYCANNKGSGTWVKCDFDWTEAGSHSVGGGYIVQYYIKETIGLWSWSGK